MSHGPLRRAGSVSLTVVVATYEWPDALRTVLCALAEQDDPDFEVVVADDGSGPDTAAVVWRWRAAHAPRRLVHVRHEDAGFRRARILNAASLEALGEKLVFLDGDCIPRPRFVRAVKRALLPGWYLSTKRVNLDHELTRRTLDEGLPVWRWSVLDWMIRGRRVARRPGFFMPLRDRRRPWRPGLPDFEQPGGAHGFFCAVSRADFVRVGGWDMEYEGWGYEDTDFVTRLRRLGLRCGWPGPRATVLHLRHPPRKRAPGQPWPPNKARLVETMTSDRIEAVAGIGRLAAGRQV